MKRLIITLAILTLPTLASAHDCCRPINWQEFESELKAAIDMAGKKADDALACSYARLYGDIYAASDPSYPVHHRSVKKTHRYWSDRCEKMQAEAIDEAY